MGDITIDAERFFARLGKLEGSLTAHKADWDGMDALCIPLGPTDADTPYSKGASMHLYLLGYEFPDSIMLLTKGNFYFMATPKKCKYLKEWIVDKQDENTNNIKIHLLERTKDDGQNRELMHNLLSAARKNNGSKLGSFYKQDFQGKVIPSWMEMVKGSGLDMIEAAQPIGKFLSVKDETEIVS